MFWSECLTFFTTAMRTSLTFNVGLGFLAHHIVISSAIVRVSLEHRDGQRVSREDMVCSWECERLLGSNRSALRKVMVPGNNSRVPWENLMRMLEQAMVLGTHGGVLVVKWPFKYLACYASSLDCREPVGS